jgi:hypothetical protein
VWGLSRYVFSLKDLCSLLILNRGIQQISFLCSQPWLWGHSWLRLPSWSLYTGSQKHWRSWGWWIRLDEVEQRKRMGIQTIRITAPPTRYWPDAKCFYSRYSRHASPSAIKAWYHCRSFKRRTAPSSISSKARSGQDPRPTKRLRRSSRETTERLGPGDLDANSVHSGSVPKLQRQSPRSYRHAEPSNDERATTVGSPGGEWTRTNIRAKGHESIVLWYGSEVLIDVASFANRYVWIRLRLADVAPSFAVRVILGLYYRIRVLNVWHGSYWKVLTHSIRFIV